MRRGCLLKIGMGASTYSIPSVRISSQGTLPLTQLSFRASLLTADNPSVVALIRDQLPPKSMLNHAFIPGKTFWMPIRILCLGRGNTVQRQPSAVSYYAPGRSICLYYRRVTESAKVNQFGRVFGGDFNDLQAIRKPVYQQRSPTETLQPCESRLA